MAGRVSHAQWNKDPVSPVQPATLGFAVSLKLTGLQRQGKTHYMLFFLVWGVV